eukprot:GGOE01040519.1.p1 GENE.GGOE01040519.1~~GGOE01040519.1.p1  ORF type:complete len:1050 (-),score=198.52 GGOE01040519.1:218-3367(-)
MGVLDWLQEKYTGPNGKLVVERERRLARTLDQQTGFRSASPAPTGLQTPQRTHSPTSVTRSNSPRLMPASPRAQLDGYDAAPWPPPSPSGSQQGLSRRSPFPAASRSSSPALSSLPTGGLYGPPGRPASPSARPRSHSHSHSPSATLPLHLQAQARLLAQAQAHANLQAQAPGRIGSPLLREAYDHHPVPNQVLSARRMTPPAPSQPPIFSQPPPRTVTSATALGPTEEELVEAEAQAKAVLRAEEVAAEEAAQCGQAEADARQSAAASISAAETAHREAELLEAAVSQTMDGAQRQWVQGAAAEARAKAQAHGAEASHWLAEAEQFRSATADASEQTRLLQSVRAEIEAPLALPRLAVFTNTNHLSSDGRADVQGSPITAACLRLEERWQQWGGRPVTFHDLVRWLHSHALVWTPHTAPPTCHGCGWQPGLWACPDGRFQPECQHCLWACQSCYDSGLQVHTGPLGDRSKAFALAALQRAFSLADLNGNGALSFLEFLHLMVVLNRHPWSTLPDRPVDGTEVLLEEFETNATPEGLPFALAEVIVARHVGFVAALPRLWALHTGGRPHCSLPQFVAVLFASLRPFSPFLTRPQQGWEYAPPPVPTVQPSSTRVLPDIVNFDLRQLRRVRLLGHDEQCVMWLVEYAGMRCTAKWPLTITTAEELRATFRAASLQARVRHPNVQRVLAVVEDGPLPTILLEVASRGDLTDWYGADPPPAALWRVFRQVADAVHALHSTNPPIMHRNLQGKGVLLTEDQEVKLGDFDLAVELVPPLHHTMGSSGMPGFVAPEVLAGFPYDCQADVYSFGCFMYEVAHGHPPFTKELEERPPPPGTDWAAAIVAMTLEGLRPTISSHACPPGLRALIRDCWEMSPAKRPTMAQVIRRLDCMQPQFPGSFPAIAATPAALPLVLDDTETYHTWSPDEPLPRLQPTVASPAPNQDPATSHGPRQLTSQNLSSISIANQCAPRVTSSLAARHRSFSPSLATASQRSSSPGGFPSLAPPASWRSAPVPLPSLRASAGAAVPSIAPPPPSATDAAAPPTVLPKDRWF